MTRRRRLIFILLGVAVIVVLALGLAWVARGRLAGVAAQIYFRQHGIPSQVTVGALGFSGFSSAIALGPADAPVFSASAVEVKFNPLMWKPQVVEVRLLDPVIRASMDADGRITLPALQDWIKSLTEGGGKSDLISDDLAVSLSHLTATVASPAGPLVLTGDVRLKRNDLQSAALSLRPGAFSYRGARVNLTSADVRIEKGGQAVIHARGSFAQGTRTVDDVTLAGTAEKVTWVLSPELSFSSSALHLSLAAPQMRQGDMAARDVKLALDGSALSGGKRNGKLEGSAAFHMTGSAGFAAPALVKSLSALDPRLASALGRNLARLELDGSAHVTAKAGIINVTTDAPIIMHGADKAVLKIIAPSYANGAFGGPLTLSLAGGGMPGLMLTANDIQTDKPAADLSLNAHFDFYTLHGAALAARGRATFDNGTFAFAAKDCAPASMTRFAAGDLARDIKGNICAARITANADGWRFDASARDVAMALPIGTARLADGAGTLSFSGKGADFGGAVHVTGGKVSDAAPTTRFNPLTGGGNIKLASGAWTGVIAMADEKGHALGDVSFRHDMAKAAGGATINAPKITFTSDGLQPVMLSPLLAVLSHAEGNAAFSGELTWSTTGATSHGALDVGGLDFLSPMGKAHTTQSHIVLRSLLPPITETGQHLSIARIDWTIPFSALALDFSASPLAFRIDALKSGFAEGQLTLGALSVDLTGTGRTQGQAVMKSIALAPLIAASNLSSKVKLEGKVTGTIPFTLGPEGFRIVNGKLAADGPGRLSIDRSLWGEAIAINAVQDLAYQALETLAFDQLTAEINSVAAGRLQILFHIKGKSAPGKPQQAEIAVADVLDGSALSKPIALPDGTPIDLTLDTSLNFDELLKSYAEAWSKTLKPD